MDAAKQKPQRDMSTQNVSDPFASAIQSGMRYALPVEISLEHTMDQVRLVIIDDSRLFREGLRQILQAPSFEINDAASVQDILDQFEWHCPHVIVWGPSASEKTLKAAAETIRATAAGQSIRLVALVDPVNAQARRRLAALDFDAMLAQNISSDVLRRYIDLVLLGQQIHLSPRCPPIRPPLSLAGDAQRIDLESCVFPKPADWEPEGVSAEQDPPYEVVLSERENQVLQHLGNGASNKSIALALRIAETTVKVHVKSLLRKTRAANRTQAAVWALHNAYRVAAQSGEAGLSQSPRVFASGAD